MGNVQAVQFHPEKSGGKHLLHLTLNIRASFGSFAKDGQQSKGYLA
jgi:hypothetical protein